MTLDKLRLYVILVQNKKILLSYLQPNFASGDDDNWKKFYLWNI